MTAVFNTVHRVQTFSIPARSIQKECVFRPLSSCDAISECATRKQTIHTTLRVEARSVVEKMENGLAAGLESTCFEAMSLPRGFTRWYTESCC